MTYFYLRMIDRETFLHDAAGKRSADYMNRLLDKLPPHIIKKLFMMKGRDYRTPLHIAAEDNPDENALLGLIKYITDPSNGLGGELHVKLQSIVISCSCYIRVSCVGVSYTLTRHVHIKSCRFKTNINISYVHTWHVYNMLQGM